MGAMKQSAWLAGGLALGLAGCGIVRGSGLGRTAARAGGLPAFGRKATETAYRAVLMSDGMVLFGKLHGLGTPFPVLTDVYYVQTVVNPMTKTSAPVLIKRGKEWDAPDRTVLNASQIILIEPVTKGSKIMNLIKKESASN